MTMQERQEIFAKEYLSIEDVQKLYDINPNQASQLILAMKRKLKIGKSQTLRLDVRGKIHIQDYLDCMDIKSDRYSIGLEGNGSA